MVGTVLETLYSRAEPLFGRTLEDPELQVLLKSIGRWPVGAFDSDEDFSLYVEEKAQGFNLLFEDADTVNHPSAAEKSPRTPIFVGAFFYAEGVEGYSTFRGHLPLGIVWNDTATALLAKLGSAKNEIKNKKTGQLMSHRWQIGPLLLTATYGGGGTNLEEVYVGIT